MTNDFRTEVPTALAVGQVLYRCAACDGVIETPSVAFTGDGPTTRTWHPQHVPGIAYVLRPRLLEPAVYSLGETTDGR